jgi:lipopolysaccharide heptosyltransferase II
MMIKRILIVNVNWVGDVIFSTPFIRAVREAHPGAYIACLLHPRCTEMLEANPHLNEIIVYDEDRKHKGLIGKIALIMALRKKRFDMAFLLHRSFTKALITFLAGIPKRVGYPTKNRGGILTKVVEAPDEAQHKVEYFLNIARAVDIRMGDVSYEFFVEDADRRFVRELLAGEGIGDKDPVVVLCPGGNWDPKRWPRENFASLGDLLSEKTGARIVISGAPKDAALAESILALMKHRPVIAAGRTTLKQLGALLERANLVIANDSGPMHIAVAVKARTIALFGPTSPLLTGPYGKGNYRIIVGKPPVKDPACEVPCYDVTCNKSMCMADICVADVLSKAREMLN